jgi:ADP-ribose pyrophosphatase YjhB (NUDIX family)
MRISAGLLIKYKNKYLFCHPTNTAWVGTFGPPKGGIEENETLIKAALRETEEEVGIVVDEQLISNKDEPIEVIYYRNRKKNAIHKMVYLFSVEINSLDEIGLETEIVPKTQLQTEEVDWAGFLSKEELQEKSFFRFKYLTEILN